MVFQDPDFGPIALSGAGRLPGRACAGENPRSGMASVAGLAGILLHLTPLYPVFSNLVAKVLLVRLWSISVPSTFVVGMHPLLNRLARFVEESKPAEPQSPVM
jgi:hypothetical protein